MGEHLEERAGKFSQTAAVSYEINPRFTIGAEALHEIDIPNLEQSGEICAVGRPKRLGPLRPLVCNGDHASPAK